MSRELSISELSELSNLDRATVRKRLVKLKPIQKKVNAVLYDGYEALKILFGNDLTDEGKVTEELLKEQLRYERARADKTSLEVEKLRREVVPIADVASAVGSEYTRVRSRLMSIPSRCAMDLSLESNPALVKQRLEEEVSEALSELTSDQIYEEKYQQPEETNNA